MQNQPQQCVQQQPTVVMVLPQALGDKFKRSSLSQMRVLSNFQIVIGVLCIVFGAALTGLSMDINSHYYALTGYTGCGIWIGVWYIIVGGIGIGAVRRNSSCWIISTMVLNIVSCSAWCPVLVYLSAIGIRQMSYELRWEDDSHMREEINAHLAMNCLLLLLAIAELAITIWNAVLCCEAACRCCKSSKMATQYYTTQQPMMYGGGTAVAYPGAQPIAVQGQYVQPMGVQPQPTVQIQPQSTVQIQPQQPPNYVETTTI